MAAPRSMPQLNCLVQAAAPTAAAAPRRAPPAAADSRNHTQSSSKATPSRDHEPFGLCRLPAQRRLQIAPMAQTITAAIDARGRVLQAQQRDALGPRSARRALLPVRWWWPLPLYQSWCCLRAWRAPQPHQLRRRPADHPHRLVHRCSRHLRHLQHLQKHQEPQRMPLPLQQGLHHHVHQSLPARHARGLLREHQTPRAPRQAARACVHQWLSIPHPEFVHPHFRAARSRRGQFESPQRMRVVILQRARIDAALPHTPLKP